MQRKTADFTAVFFSVKNMEKHNVYSMHRSDEGVYYSLKGSM
ncbi:hypothetical protein MY9_2307 [Bacillus sp. JS]|nr:hypothetical protein MY9_2307 [Bacillus sp. JS]